MRGPIVWLIAAVAAAAMGGGASAATQPAAGERITPLAPAIVYGQRPGSFVAARLEDGGRAGPPRALHRDQ
jgi:hypothetical protein